MENARRSVGVNGFQGDSSSEGNPQDYEISDRREQNLDYGEIVDFLVRLSVASKSRSFYPPDHPAVRDSLLILKEIASNIAKEHPIITFDVRSDGFYLYGNKVAPSKEKLVELCRRLRAMCVSGLTIDFNFTLDDVKAFVDLLSMDPMVVMTSGGAQGFLGERGIDTFLLKESGLCRDEHDIESGALFAGKKEREYGSEEREGSAQEREKEGEHKLNALSWELFHAPEKGAEAIRRIWESDFSDPHDKASRLLELIDGMVSNFPREGDLDVLLRHLGEALLFLDSEVRDHLLEMVLGHRGKRFTWSYRFISVFTDRELIDLLAGLLFNRVDVVDQVRDFVLDIYEEGEAQVFLRRLREKFLALGAPTEQAARLYSFSHSDRPPGKEELLQVIKAERANRQEEKKGAPIIPDLWTATLDEFPPLLLSMLEKGEMVENLEVVAGWAREITTYLLGEGEIERLADLIRGLRDIISTGYLPPKVEASLNETLSELAEQSSLRSVLVDSFYRSEDKTNEAKRVAGLVSLLGEEAMRNLVEILANEEKVGIRKFICQVLVYAGVDNIHLLGSYVLDDRWYLARNIVYVLGSIGDVNSLIYVKMAMKHPHEKVREEAIRALGLMGSVEAQGELINALRHEDAVIRIHALRWLERIGTEAATEAMLKVVEDGLVRGRDEALLEEAISALVRMGSRRAYPALSAIAGQKRLLGKKRWERIASLAREGMCKLESLYPDLRDGEREGR